MRGLWSNTSFRYAYLRRSAYGKAVVVETETLGRQVYRLSQTSAVISPNTCNLATPHSPVGRLCSVIEHGDEDENKLWGYWRVAELRLFDRFDGLHFEENVRNFLRMEVTGDDITEVVMDLEAFLRRPPRGVEAPPPEPEHEEMESPLAPAPFILVDEEDEDHVFLGDIDDSDELPEVRHQAPAGYFGLSETFYLNRTREQDEIIARSPIGGMFVEGVAGSGKTSAALGRTKMLCDFDVSSVSSEAEFREVLGPDAAYWDGKFAGQFSQESSVGFVRTGELIQYLKETCRRIDLPNLPVLEYRELQTRLREHRGLVAGKMPRSWSGASVERESTQDTTMAWLHATDFAIASLLASRLPEMLPAASEIARGIEDRYAALALQVAQKAVHAVSTAVEELVAELVREPTGHLRLDRVLVRMFERVNKVRREVLGKDVLWLRYDGNVYAAASEGDLARTLIANGAELYDRHGNRLIWAEGGRLLAPDGFAFVDAQGSPVPWSASVPGGLADGSIMVTGSAGRRVRGQVQSRDDLYMRLLADTSDKAYRLRDNALVALRLERGLGRVRMPLKQEEPEHEAEQEDGATAPDLAGTAPRVMRRRTLDSRFQALMRQRLLAPFRDMAALYLAGIKTYPEVFPEASVVENVQNGLMEGKLTSADVDLLLCLFHVVGRSYSGTPGFLAEPSYYQSVFIDEVQDFSEQQVFLMAQQARPEYRAVTAVGDLAQKLHNGTSIDVQACFPDGRLDYVRLSRNMRQAKTPALALFSACFREVVHQDGEVAQDVGEAARSAGHGVSKPYLEICPTDADLDDRLLQELAAVASNQTAVVAFPDRAIAEAVFERLRSRISEKMINADLSGHVDLSKRFVRHFTTIENTKGLEFDVVLLPLLERYDLSTALDQNRLYVGISRARERLVLLSGTAHLDSLLASSITRFESFGVELGRS